MRKIGQEIKFQQIRDFVQRQIDVVSRKPESDKLEMLEGKLKELDQCLKKISQDLIGNKRFNQGDVRSKINNYQQQKTQLRRRLEAIILSYKQKLLTKKASFSSDKNNNDYNYTLLQQLHQHKKIVDRKFQTAGQTIEDTNAILQEQIKDRQNFVEKIDGVEVELDLISQFMRTISNRNLLTKIILVLLILFLGLADIAIIILKIM